MAQKKQSKTRKKKSKDHRLRTVGLLIAVPVIVWMIAFFIWFHWENLSRWLGVAPVRQKPASTARPIPKEEARRDGGLEKPQERITDEERRKLEGILKQRN